MEMTHIVDLLTAIYKFIGIFFKNLISIATLGTVVSGFVVFSTHSKKLEKIQLYREVIGCYDNFRIYNEIKDFSDKYKDTFIDYMKDYHRYIKSKKDTNISLSDSQKKNLDREELLHIFVALQRILFLWLAFSDFTRNSRITMKWCVPIIYVDIIEFDIYIREIIQNSRFLCKNEIEKVEYAFEHIHFHKALLDNYEKLIKASDEYFQQLTKKELHE